MQDPLSPGSPTGTGTFGELFDQLHATGTRWYQGSPPPTSVDAPPGTRAHTNPSSAPLPAKLILPTLPNAAAYHVSVEWTMPHNQTYEPHLRNLFMSFAHQHASLYKRGAMFSLKQLLQLQPTHVRDSLAKKAFVKVNWSYEAGDRPLSARASTMEMAKKAVS